MISLVPATKGAVMKPLSDKGPPLDYPILCSEGLLCAIVEYPLVSLFHDEPSVTMIFG